MNARRTIRTMLIVYIGVVYALLAAANLPRLVGWTPTLVLSGSMRPAIRAGDIVVLAPVRQGDAVSVGDVITVSAPEMPGGTYLHRVVATTVTGTLLTRGDANRQNDFPPVHPASIRGRARLVLPFVGIPYLRLRSGDPIPILAAAAPLLVFARPRPPKDTQTQSGKTAQPDGHN